MLVSGEPSHRIAEPFPHGIEKGIKLNTRTDNPEWRLVRRGDTIFAQPTVGGPMLGRSEINLSTEDWEPQDHFATVGLRFKLAPADNTLIEARELLARSHPHGAPSTGVFIVCSMSDPEAQRRLLSRPLDDRNDPWSSAWGGRLGSVVGCVVLSRLFHGNPGFRREIAAVEGTNIDGRPRDQIVDLLGLIWLSRVAVDAPYRSCGIGRALVAEARRVAADRLPWSARYVEVIRTVTAKQAKRRHEKGYEDFFTQAGYNLAEAERGCAPMRDFNRDGTRMTYVQSCKRIYYWARVP
jgi:GNAT superfamily N-acetyltransferase